jgi:DNA polymerase-3 subunit alpha
VPETVRLWVDEERRRHGLTWKSLGELSGVAMRQFAAPDSRGKFGFRRSTLMRLASSLESDRLKSIATSDVFWDRVISIEPKGEQATYDLAVETDHNFVADGLVVHNSHAYCYALVAYQTAYLKANYPVEWFASVLSTIAADTDKVVGVVGECRRVGVGVLPPDVNASELEFRVESSGIRFGLAAVKNVGEGAVEQIVRDRETNGPYTSLEEFCRRQDLHTVNKRVIESLIKCGAMDGLGQREVLLDSKRLDSAIAAAQIDQRAASTGQTSLFDIFGGSEAITPAPPVAIAAANGVIEVNSRERALWEKDVLGFQFGEHPFMEAAAWLAGQLTHDTSQLTAEISGEKVKIAGLVTGVRRILTRAKSQMAVLIIEDLHGTIEAVVFPRVYERATDVFREDTILVIEGKVDTRGERPQIVVDRAEPWTPPPAGTPRPAFVYRAADPPPAPPQSQSESQSESNGVPAGDPLAKESEVDVTEKRVLRVVVPRGDDDNACVRLLEQLHVLVQRFPGEDEIQLVLHDRAGGRIELAGADIPIKHSSELESQVRTLVGENNLEVVCSVQEMARVAPTSRGPQ